MRDILRAAGLAVMLCVAAAATTEAEVRLSSMIGDNMVLQQNSNARIWGTADPGEKVTVVPSWDGKKYNYCLRYSLGEQPTALLKARLKY